MHFDYLAFVKSRHRAQFFVLHQGPQNIGTALWWGEAILTACHVLNRVFTKNKEITPFEEWEKKMPTLILTYMGLFGINECANNQETQV